MMNPYNRPSNGACMRFIYIVSHQHLGAEDFGQSCQAPNLHVYRSMLDLGVS